MIVHVHFIVIFHLQLCTAGNQQIYNLACVSIKDSGQPAHQHRLIRVFGGRTLDSHQSNFFSGEILRL